MSWHLSHRLTTVHRAVSTALLYSVGYAALSSSAHAANIGETVISSAQHEPLVASIVVTDINVADFSASLADASVYQRMGLTPTASMSVRFKPTSATSGQVLISTQQPVSMPFADIVLAINDGGKRNMMPKTLLMPLSDSVPIKPDNTVIANTKRPNLPSVSTSNAKPLTVRTGAPPPLLAAPSMQQPVTLTSKAQTANSQAPVQALGLPTQLSAAAQLNNASDRAVIRQDNSRLETGNQIDSVAPSSISSNNSVSSSNVMGNTASTPNITDKQLDILNVQITRQIRRSNEDRNTPNMNNRVPSPFMPTPSDTAQSGTTSPIANSETTSHEFSSNAVAPSNIPLRTKNESQAEPAQAKGTTVAATNSSAVNYTVQRNDNLWVIAQQIADQNNVDVQTVMAEIKSQNPDAFINQNANQLRADAQLNLPNYDVVPSQQKMQAAISAKRQYSAPARVPAVKKPTESKPAPKVAAEAKPAPKRSPKSANTTTQKLPEARFSVLAPGRDGNADGTQTQTASKTGNGLSTDILATLKSSRQRTAAQAEQLSKTSNTLGIYTKKLQLQNQKLAELQARLKQLRNQ